jgi:hypothetical protein
MVCQSLLACAAMMSSCGSGPLNVSCCKWKAAISKVSSIEHKCQYWLIGDMPQYISMTLLDCRLDQ